MYYATTDCWAHAASYPWDAGVISHEYSGQGMILIFHLHVHAWSHTSTSPCGSIEWCLMAD